MNLDQVLAREGAVQPADQAVIEQGRASVEQVARAELHRRAAMLRIRRHRRTRRFAFGLTAVAAVALTVATQIHLTSSRAAAPAATAPTVSPSRNAPSVTATFTTVAEILNAASDAKGVPALGSAPYWQVKSQYRTVLCEVNSSCHQVAGTRDIWIGVTAPGVLNDTGIGHGRPVPLPIEAIAIGGTTYRWDQINARSWTTSQLLGLVAGGGSSPWYLFKNIGDVLTESPASPAIRAQLWRALAQVPGIKNDGQAKDDLDRTGWKISISDPQQGTASYIIDTATGMLLQSSKNLVWGNRPGTQPRGFDLPSVYTYTLEGPAYTAPTTSRAAGPGNGG